MIINKTAIINNCNMVTYKQLLSIMFFLPISDIYIMTTIYSYIIIIFLPILVMINNIDDLMILDLQTQLIRWYWNPNDNWFIFIYIYYIPSGNLT